MEYLSQDQIRVRLRAQQGNLPLADGEPGAASKACPNCGGFFEASRRAPRQRSRRGPDREHLRGALREDILEDAAAASLSSTT